jgi:hypothetical protein
MSFWANVVWANVTMGKRCMGKCLWANVSGQMSLGKCLWANVVWANVMEPFETLMFKRRQYTKIALNTEQIVRFIR